MCMSDIDVNGIRFFPSYYSTIMSIPDDGLRLKAFEVVTTYMMTGQEPEEMDWQIKAILEALRPNIDKSRDASERGSKGGRPKKASEKEVLQTEKPLTKEVLESEKQIEREEEVEIEVEIGCEEGEGKKETPAPEEPPMYGRNKNIPLTPEEYAELEKEIGFAFYDVLNNLSDHMASTGKTYKSYPATIRKWYRQDKEKEKTRGKPKTNGFSNFQQRGYTDADYAEIERQNIRRRA